MKIELSKPAKLTRAVLACVAFASCAQELDPTEVVVSIHSDLVVGSELTRVDVQTHDRTGRRPGRKQTFQLAGDTGEGHRVPFSFGLVRGSEDDVLLTVSGFGAGDEEKSVIAYTTAVHFVAEQTLLLDVFLGRACYDESCGKGMTCEPLAMGSEAAGSCRPIRDARTVVGRPGNEIESWVDPSTPPAQARDGGVQTGRRGGEGTDGDDGADRLDGGIAANAADSSNSKVDANTTADDAEDAGEVRDATRSNEPQAPPDAEAPCDGASCAPACTSPMVECSGVCKPPGSTCAAPCTGSGKHMCSGQCVPNDEAHCGESCAPCDAPPNGSSVCDVGVCVHRCNAGYHLCGGTCASDSSPATCGTRCEPCAAVENGTATCNGGMCGVICQATFSACGDGTCRPRKWTFEDGSTQGAVYNELNSKALSGPLRVSTQRAHSGRYALAADANGAAATNVNILLPLCAPDVAADVAGRTFGLWLYFEGTGTLSGDLAYYWFAPSASKAGGEFTLVPNRWIYVSSQVPSDYPDLRSFGFYLYLHEPWRGTIYIDDGAIE